MQLSGEALAAPEANFSAKKYAGDKSKSFDFKESEFDDAKKAAAREGKKLVVTYYSKSAAGSQQYVEKTLPDLKKQFGDKAIFVGVNLDEVDKGSELGRRADQSIGSSGQSIRGSGIVYTEMGSVSPGADNKPGEFKSTCTLAGIGSELKATLAQQTQFTDSAIASTKGKFKFGPMEPREYARTDRPQKQGEVKPAEVAEANKTVQTELDAAHKAKTFDEAEKHYLAAMKAADSVSMGQLDQLRKSLALKQKEAEEKKEGDKSKDLAKQLQQVDDLLEAKSTTRKELGLACGKSGNPDAGVKWLAEAARRNKDFRDNPDEYLLLEMSADGSGFTDKHRQELLGLLKKPEYAALTDDKLEVPKPSAEVDDGHPKWTRIKSKKDWDEAVARAEKEHKPLVVVGGGRDWCPSCKKLEDNPEYRAAIQKYGKDAVIVHIDPVVRHEVPGKPPLTAGEKAEAAIGTAVANQLDMQSFPAGAVVMVKGGKLFTADGKQITDKTKPQVFSGSVAEWDAAIGRGIGDAKKLIPPKEEKRKPNPFERPAYAFLDFSDDIYGT